jgi:hypothetical protein
MSANQPPQRTPQQQQPLWAPPQWTPQPQTQSPSRGWRARFDRLPQGGKVALILASSLLIQCCACGLFVGTVISAVGGSGSTCVAHSPTATVSSTVSSTGTTASTTSTPAPTATATPAGTQPVSGPTLGGTAASFRQTYGDPSGEGQFSYYDATINCTSVLVAVGFIGGKGGPRADYVHLAPRMGFLHLVRPDSGTVWSEATADAIARVFLPPDAHFVTRKAVPNYGAERVYRSGSLAASFSNRAFGDLITDRLTTPGTFSYACGNRYDPEGGCRLRLGE